MLVIIKVLTWMASPIGFLVWGVGLGLLLRLSKWKKTAGTLVGLAILQVAVFSLPIVANQLMSNLEQDAKALESANNQAQRILSGERYAAIVLLGGATSPAEPPERPYPELGGAVDRIWHAARLYKQGLAPKIILSGGRSPGLEGRTDLQTEAQAMRLLLLDLGVPDNALVLEESSRSTKENVNNTKTLVGNQPVALVTSAFHMPRAMRNFQEMGVKAYAYPTDFQANLSADPLWARLLPKAKSLEMSETALKEYLALAVRY